MGVYSHWKKCSKWVGDVKVGAILMCTRVMGGHAAVALTGLGCGATAVGRPSTSPTATACHVVGGSFSIIFSRGWVFPLAAT
ncbi:MAG: hypothetical protein OT477_06380 [Chloroflexi bacterium]|nr:hypothetical protein [Chloroflexota bacterium]